MKKGKTSDYNNVIVMAAGALSLLCAVTILVLFIVFVSIKKPSYRDLSKYVFVTLCIDFVLTAVHGVSTFMKDPKIGDYGMKTWAISVVCFATVAILNVFAIYKHHDRVLPTISLCIPLGVATLAMLMNTVFFFFDAAVPILDYAYEPFEEFSDFEDNENLDGFTSKEQSAPSNIPGKTHLTVNTDGSLKWNKTHFIIAIENSITMKKRLKQVKGGLRCWLKSLDSSRNVNVSMITFSSIPHNGRCCRTPSELIHSLNDESTIQLTGNTDLSLSAALDGIKEMMNDKASTDKMGKDWLHYGIVIASDGSNCSKEALDDFKKFQTTLNYKFFINAITQSEMTTEVNKLVEELGGVHYKINSGANYGNAIVASLKKDPF